MKDILKKKKVLIIIFLTKLPSETVNLSLALKKKTHMSVKVNNNIHYQHLLMVDMIFSTAYVNNKCLLFITQQTESMNNYQNKLTLAQRQ